MKSLLLALSVSAPLLLGAADATNFVVVLAEAQGWANTSVLMDERIPASRSRDVTTPALERLAGEGIRFARGYAASPRCTPSRAALLTGKSPAALHMTYVGARRNWSNQRTALLPPEPILELPPEVVTVAERLREAGYATAHFGKWHLGRAHPSRHGFGESDGPTGNGGPDHVADPNPEQAWGITTRGIEFLTRQQRAGRPFYLQLSHYPNQGRREGADEVHGRGERTPDEVDRTVSELLAAIDRLGLSRSTYVIYTADHGAQERLGNGPLSGGKGAVTEGGLRVPFLIRGPGIPTNVCSRVPVTACDLMPTLLELAGIPSALPEGVEGGSLVPLLLSSRSQVRRPREELVFHFPHYDLNNEGPATAILLGHHKLIWNYERANSRLFDLEADPAEAQDLSGQLPLKTQELLARLRTHLRDVGAQLPVPNPDIHPTNTVPDRPAGPQPARPHRNGTPPP